MNISYQCKDNGRNVLTLFVDAEEWRNVHTAIFGKKPVFPKACADMAEWSKCFSDMEYRGAFAYALKILALKTRTTAELTKKLDEHFVSQSIVERIVAECTQRGYLNDAQWVESFVKYQAGRHVGPQIIALKLRAKGISSEAARHAIADLTDEDSHAEHITHLLRTRFAKRDLSIPKERNKVIASLMRKGFSLSVIKAAFDLKIDEEETDFIC